MTTLESRRHLLIGSSWERPSRDDEFRVISPATEDVVGSLPRPSTGDVDRAVEAACAARDRAVWSDYDVDERADILRQVRDHCAGRLDELETMMALESGQPIEQLRGRLGSTLSVFDDAIESSLGVSDRELRRDRSGRVALVGREPVGVVAAITPFNGPFVMSVSKGVRALMAGCTVVLKPALEGALQAYFLADAFEAVGLPDGVVSMLPGDAEVGHHLVGRDGVDMVTFTGSTAAGRRVAAVCGERLTRTSLELGGKSAAVILDDADLEAATAVLEYAAFANAGQVCIALSRILAPRSRYDEVVDRLVSVASSLVPGDPFDPATTIGPLISQRQRDRVEEYVRLARAEHATLATGGRRPLEPGRGWFFEATVFTNVDNQMRIAQEEIFGPVTCVIPYETEAEAIALANDIPYGLHGAVFTSDWERGVRVADRVRSGTLAVNGFGVLHSAPFGGVKDSGWGREGGPEAVDDFTEYKSISLDADTAARVAARQRDLGRPSER